MLLYSITTAIPTEIVFIGRIIIVKDLSFYFSNFRPDSFPSDWNKLGRKGKMFVVLLGPLTKNGEQLLLS